MEKRKKKLIIIKFKKKEEESDVLDCVFGSHDVIEGRTGSLLSLSPTQHLLSTMVHCDGRWIPWDLSFAVTLTAGNVSFTLTNRNSKSKRTTIIKLVERMNRHNLFNWTVIRLFFYHYYYYYYVE